MTSLAVKRLHRLLAARMGALTLTMTTLTLMSTNMSMEIKKMMAFRKRRKGNITCLWCLLWGTPSGVC
jgi:hypothetical protein